MRLALALAVVAAVPAFADPPAPSFSPAQRREIVAIVRDALKSDPSILKDAIGALQAQDAQEAQAAFQSALATHRKEVFATEADATAGNPHGDATLVEFYDPRCPYCRHVLPDLDALTQRDPKLRIVYKEIPVLGPASVLESRAIIAAQNQGAYGKMQAALMHDPAQPSETMIRDHAKAIGLDADRLLRDMNSKDVTARLDANLSLSHTLEIQGTPAFIVGDTIIPGQVSADQLAAAVADARKHGKG